MWKTEDKLYKSMNLWDVNANGVILGTSGEAAAVYRIRPVKDLTLLDSPACDGYIRAIRQALATLPPSACLSFYADTEKWENPHIAVLKERVGQSDGTVREILSARISAMQRLKSRKTNLYLCITLHPVDFLRLPILGKTIFHFLALNSLRKKFDDQFEKLKTIESLVTSQLSAYAEMERLDRKAAVHFYWKHLNPGKAQGNVHAPEPKSYWSLRCQLGISPAKEEKDHLWMDGMNHRTLSLFSFSEFLELGGIDKLLSKLPVGSRLAVNFMAVELEAALDRAKAGARRSEGLSFLQGSKNYEAQAKAAELDELITLARSSGEKIFISSLTLTLRHKKAPALDYETNRTLTLFREALGADGIVEDLNHKRLFFSGLPFGSTLAPRRHTLTGEACAHLAPLSSPWEGCAKPGIFFGTREGGSVSVDPFDGDTPRHGIVIGSTGSGKSFTMNYLTSSLFAIDPNTHFVIVDVGGSYKRLCDVSGGKYYEINLSKEFALNPFPHKDAIMDTKGNYDPDLMGYLSLLIEKMLDSRCSQNQKRIIEGALKRAYDNCGSAPGPILGDFVETLNTFPSKDPQDKEDALKIARELRLFTEGSYGAIFNSAEGIDPFSNRLAVFDLAKLKEHRRLQGILMTVIGFGLARQMSRRDVRKVVILDEGWEFFDDDNASELISRLYRTARKFNAAIISVSQSPKDFLKSKASTAMLANSYWKVVLRLDMGHDDLAAFAFNSKQIEQIKTLTMKARTYSELFIVFGVHCRVLRVEPTSLEYWISTTNAQECVMEAELIKTRPNVSRINVLKELAIKEPVYAA